LAEKLRAPTQEDFQSTREALLEAGLIVKGRGRGGSTARAIPLELPAFELEASKPGSPSKPAKPAVKNTGGKSAAQTASTDKAQLARYLHPQRRANNPEVGLVSEAGDPEQAKTGQTRGTRAMGKGRQRKRRLWYLGLRCGCGRCGGLAGRCCPARMKCQRTVAIDMTTTLKELRDA
jgi:hypothetical protein